ncbi:Cell division GTPase FtsZ [Dehalogenimonas formicexedens]|uniref:Tubulin-like protein CetZ n=1 Tax=Dehalogenimonas formicexedens TaxID=1839801 RepID=A0A1P8F774_9CHLR|nr:hypothetical protein [Dehalogenimonas formicexedens]APV44308.1 Cell division GTPase FtsZ [Dehalogenimonas formicexedens]
MKLMVIGLGQCGGRLADDFITLQKRAHDFRKVEILTGVYVVDTDASSLRGLSQVPQKNRLVIGENKTRGRGVGRQSEVAAQIARDEGFKVIDAIRQSKRFAESDAFLLVGATAGGTAAGCMPVIAEILKERFRDLPVYGIEVLPFEHEESLEKINVTNTAYCLVNSKANMDAVFVIDNQRYAKKGLSWSSNISEINRAIVEPFYGLLCAGEEKKRQHIGVSMLSTSDVQSMLSGWTTIGYGKTLIPMITLPWDKQGDETTSGRKAMEEAISELSVQCDTKQATKAMYLVSAPEKEIGTDLVKYLGEFMKSIAPEAPIRYGDYPVEKGLVDVTAVLSGFPTFEKIQGYFTSMDKQLAEMPKASEVQKVA